MTPPNTEFVNFKWKTPGNNKLVLYDLQGRFIGPDIDSVFDVIINKDYDTMILKAQSGMPTYLILSK